jgi:RNA polymerase sigma-70 factor (ECF subfamily)
MSDTSDEELVRRIRAGDEAAEAALFDRYAPRLREQARRRLHGILRRRVGDSDVAQEACLAAFDSLDRFEDQGEGSFARWLQAILRHKADDTVRRHVGAAKRGGGVEVSQGDAEAESALACDGPSPSRAAAGREDARDVRAAIQRLAEPYRTVLDLVHRCGMTLAEVGEATGRTANATCKVYGRAVQALARVLREARGSADGP